ncbi:hypothetical protein SBP02_04680 [Pseudomonas benzenivorans]|uniref:Uncharacterized protein n=1 Tax=Pseudomonas benzenivorans TaxID=556533 RepID=A0ABZ0PY25_9PSED|nr:hypothetical protein [Pseudomonas benzenivorans]WPC06053.1 hypothetical protein SBP02_04680 [Pseudomonas benzenivorans]
MTLDNLRIVQLGERLREAWQQPHPAFASGRDARSSDNGLLLQCYGNLTRAAGAAWQNAGRTLIDKTYLRMLKDCAGLDFLGLSADELAARLDGFIRRELAPRWAQLEQWRGAEGLEPALALLEAGNRALFDDAGGYPATSWLLFYLCPQLPLLPVPAGAAPHAWLQRAQELQAQLPVLPRPRLFAGDAREQALIRQLIEGSDWWRRRVLAAWLAAPPAD